MVTTQNPKRFIFGLIGLLLLVGCNSVERRAMPAITVYTTGYLDVHPSRLPQARNTFSRNEIVAVIVRSIDTKQRPVLVEVFRSSDNQLVYKSLVYSHSGIFNICNLQKPVAAGNYSVRLTEEGKLLDAASFGVF
ncbi:MAG TPA: hypothetical protein VMZ27_02095 [Candidatus Saccharimonadales bacterium]|nr:hypothetical protein [Candidatus Saccharimonadales bacterium]